MKGFSLKQFSSQFSNSCQYSECLNQDLFPVKEIEQFTSAEEKIWSHQRKRRLLKTRLDHFLERIEYMSFDIVYSLLPSKPCLNYLVIQSVIFRNPASGHRLSRQYLSADSQDIKPDDNMNHHKCSI